MIPRSQCPDCGRLHAVVGRGEGRGALGCRQCGRIWAPHLEAARPPGSPRCRDHPDRAAPWICAACDAAWCEPCGRRVSSHGHSTALSPCCRDGLTPLAEVTPLRPFWQVWPAVARYAFRGGSPLVLGFLYAGGFVPLLSWFVPALAVIYGVHVARRSSVDPNVAPDFPEPDDVLLGFVYPCLRLVGAVVIVGMPWWLYRRFGPAEPDAWMAAAFVVAGFAVFPAIVLNAIVRDRFFAALDLAALLRMVRGMGWDYMALSVALAALTVAWRLFGGLADVHDLLAWLTPAVRLYLLTTAFHLVGRSVWQTRDRIEWGV